ncbi:MAG: hypothetical protein VB142_04380 [Burkholderia sp.]
MMDTTLLDTEKPGSRKRRPNHSPEFQRRIAIGRVQARCFSRQTGPRVWAECESGVHLTAPVSCRAKGVRGNAAASDGRERYETGGHRSATNQTGDREIGRTRWHD